MPVSSAHEIVLLWEIVYCMLTNILGLEIERWNSVIENRIQVNINQGRRLRGVWGGDTPSRHGNQQIIASQSANCFPIRQNMNCIGRKNTKILE
jgi:hypothetical protein